MSWPQMLAVPPVGEMKPASMRMVVVLPAPFGPEEAEHFARLDLEAHVVYRRERFVPLAQVFRLDHASRSRGAWCGKVPSASGAGF